MKNFQILEASAHMDDRGGHIKFTGESPKKIRIDDFTVKETFMTLNNKGTLRGMHFQVNPAQEKLITCISGSALVNVIEFKEKLSKISLTPIFHKVLKAGDNKMLYIPEGYALGYLSLENDTRMLYHAGAYFNGNGDLGINPMDDALNLNWSDSGLDSMDIILSKRDKELPDWNTFRKDMANG